MQPRISPQRFASAPVFPPMRSRSGSKYAFAAFGEVRSEHAGAARSCEKLRAEKGGGATGAVGAARSFWRCEAANLRGTYAVATPARVSQGVSQGLARVDVSQGSRECRGLANKLRRGYAQGTRGGVLQRVSQRVSQGLARVKVSQGSRSRKGLARVSQSLACARVQEPWPGRGSWTLAAWRALILRIQHPVSVQNLCPGRVSWTLELVWLLNLKSWPQRGGQVGYARLRRVGSPGLLRRHNNGVDAGADLPLTRTAVVRCSRGAPDPRPPTFGGGDPNNNNNYEK